MYFYALYNTSLRFVMFFYAFKINNSIFMEKKASIYGGSRRLLLKYDVSLRF